MYNRPTCFIRCGVCRHTPSTGLAAFGHHDGKLVHCVRLEAYDGVAERCCICGLETQHNFTVWTQLNRSVFSVVHSSDQVRTSCWSLYVICVSWLSLQAKMLKYEWCCLFVWLPCTSRWWSSWSSTSQSNTAPQTSSGSCSWSCQPRKHGPSRRTKPQLAPPLGGSWEYWCLAWEWGIYQKDGKGHPQMGLWGLEVAVSSVCGKLMKSHDAAMYDNECLHGKWVAFFSFFSQVRRTKRFKKMEKNMQVLKGTCDKREETMNEGQRKEERTKGKTVTL